MSTSTKASGGPTQAEIAARARVLWTERGSPGGRDLELWLEAEQELQQEFARRSAHASQENRARRSPKSKDLDEAERRLDGLVEDKPSPECRTPDGEQL